MTKEELFAMNHAKDVIDQTNALIRWFKSHDTSPAMTILVMCSLIGEMVGDLTHDDGEAAKQIGLITACISELAAFTRTKNRAQNCQ